VKTQNGMRKVVNVWSRRVHNNCPGTVPYKVGKMMVSGNHLVYKGGSMFYAKDIGEQIALPNKYLVYYHLETEGGVKDLLNVDE
jgi:hypothetical protein